MYLWHNSKEPLTWTQCCTLWTPQAGIWSFAKHFYILSHLSILWAFQILVSPARASRRVPFFVVLDQALASTSAVFASATALLFPSSLRTKRNHIQCTVVLKRADNNDLHSQVLSSNIWSGPHWVGGQPQLEKKCCQQSLFKLVTIAVRTCH